MPDINFYRKRLKVDKHDLDGELEVQAQYQDEIADQLALANTRMLAAKDDLAREEARLFISLKRGEDKMTNEVVNARIRTDEDRSRLFESFQSAREAHEAWQGLYEAWRQRGYSIKTLADLYAAQYFAITSVSGGSSFPGPIFRDDTVAARRQAIQEASKTQDIIRRRRVER